MSDDRYILVVADNSEEMNIARQWAENIGIRGNKLRVMFLGSHYPSLNFDHIFCNLCDDLQKP